jgi:two-component system, chemotaxis family, sensor kinase Cph1
MHRAIRPQRLDAQLSTLHQGAHACLLYENERDQLRAVAPFVRDGLARGERFAYIADDRTTSEVINALAGGAIDVNRELERGAHLLMTQRDAYLRSGEFEPEAMVDFLRQVMDEALEAAGITVSFMPSWPR